MIRVSYEVYSTRYFIDKMLNKLFQCPILSFDTETRGVYTPEERKEAKELLKDLDLPLNSKRLALLVENSSGLSFPSIIAVTHFIFGTSPKSSVILICEDPQLEIHIWNRIAEYQGMLAIHNTLYDLKIMFNRIGVLPCDYEDTQLLAKCLINHANTWKAKVGLKDLMGDDYDPRWLEMNDYEPENLRDPTFLRYAAIDGAATFKLWYDLQEYMRNN